MELMESKSIRFLYYYSDVVLLEHIRYWEVKYDMIPVNLYRKVKEWINKTTIEKNTITIITPILLV